MFLVFSHLNRKENIKVEEYNDIRVSVIMPVYNVEKYLDQALQSIIKQTLSNIEIIIVEDCSNDNTCMIVEKYSRIDKRIVPIYNKKNEGLINSLNKAIHIAKGKYIARMDADDIANVDRLKKQYEFMEANKDIDLIGTSVDFIDENNCIIQKNTFVVKNSDKIKDYLKYTNVVIHPTFFFRKSI